MVEIATALTVIAQVALAIQKANAEGRTTLTQQEWDDAHNVSDSLNNQLDNPKK
jgi:hypothetical protein